MAQTSSTIKNTIIKNTIQISMSGKNTIKNMIATITTYLKKKLKNLFVKGGHHRVGIKVHRGDILERDIYKRAKVIDRYRDKGTVRIEVDRTIIHMVHDTREILSILSR